MVGEVGIAILIAPIKENRKKIRPPKQDAELQNVQQLNTGRQSENRHHSAIFRALFIMEGTGCFRLGTRIQLLEQFAAKTRRSRIEVLLL